ncbi:MAG TPA: NADH:flavin oxidoreductase/NADH oxidase family protein [Rhizomicrobium sp.]|nr:NADH:flavin oxidoreductase/NADH oxidase family protein [Rhizomicrobium sp.]
MRLSSPLTLACGAHLSNRLAKGAMTEGLGTANGLPTAELERLYSLWSQGGAGILLTGNVQIDRRHLERPGNVIIDREPDAAMREALTRWAKAGTERGNHLWMQISHAGRQTPALINKTPKAPSAVKLGLPGGQFGQPVALTEEEILDIIRRFGVAAVAARETGFTGVQVHAAHGYLISSFLNPRANVRTDAWGGSLENRARLLMETVRHVRAKVGADFPLTVKLNSADFQRGGFAFEDSLAVAQMLQEAGIDLLEISGGSYEQPAMMDMEGLEPADKPKVAASTIEREAYFVDFAKAMKAKVSLPLMVTGGFRSLRAMQHALDTGAADVIGIGRPLCADTKILASVLDGSATELDRWENRLRLLPGWLDWLKAIKMVRGLDGFAVQYWYYAQLYALGRAGKPDHSISVWSAWCEVEKTHKRLAASIASSQ